MKCLLNQCRLSLLALLLIAPFARAQDADPAPETEPTTIQWSAKDIAGATVTVPDENQPTVLVFVRADQKRSIDMMGQTRTVLGASPDAQVVAVVSGDKANAEQLRDAAEWPWRLVADPDHKASGRMLVFAWPSAVVVDAKGAQVAHIGGLPEAYSKDLRAYLDFSHGRIDREALTKRLQSHGIVSSSNQQIANRHLQMARRLLARGEVETAQKEITEALKLVPNDVQLGLEMARIHLFKGDAEAALAALDKLPADTIAPWQSNELRGQALVLQKKWEDARTVLLAALKHNPRPAAVHYLLGQVYEKTNDPAKAAQHYRTAFEQTIEGRMLNRNPRP